MVSGVKVSKKLDAKTSAWLKTVALVIFLIVAAIVSEVFLHGRIDLTRGKDFTLAPVAVHTLEGLPDKVTVRVVMSKGLPPEFARIRTRLVDMLREFEARSDGQLELVFQDPGEDSVARVTALSLGIEEVVFQEESRAGVKTRKGFFGLALLYRDKKEYFPVLRSVETFEYDMVVRLKKLTGTVKTVGIVESVPDTAGATITGRLEFSMLMARIDPLYRIEKQSPADSAIAPRVDLLLIAAPAHLSEVAKRNIDQFVMSGKPVIFLTPGIDVDLSAGIEANPVENGYEDLLARYGILLRKNLLVEPESWERVRFGDAEFPVPYPYWIKLSYSTLNAENPVTASLHSLSFPWTSALDLNPAAQPAARYETLATTSPQAWEQNWEEIHTNLLYPRPMNAYSPNAYVPGVQKSFPLSVLVTGPSMRVLVVSNALFVSDSYADYIEASAIEANLQFILGSLDQLALDPGLISLRSRQLTDAPLDEARASRSKPLILLLNILVGPLLVLLLAGLISLRRLKRDVR